MFFSKIVSTIAFVGALVLGTAAGFIANLGTEIVTVEAPVDSSTVPVTKGCTSSESAVRAEDLVGVWSGSWGYGGEYCTIEIERVRGNKFSGTLRKEGAEITIVGTVDPEERTIFIKETKVVRLGPSMSEWSLGTNTGSFSADGRSLTGTGIDKWGEYGWEAAKE